MTEELSVTGFQEGKWEVSLHGGPGESAYEIAIVHCENTHGKRSFGWNGAGKLIISTSYQGTHRRPEPIWNDLVSIAQKWADWLSSQRAGG